MKNNSYQMVTVCEYLNMLDLGVEYLANNEQQIKETVEKYLLLTRRAKTNAKILESMLS